MVMSPPAHPRLGTKGRFWGRDGGKGSILCLCPALFTSLVLIGTRAKRAKIDRRILLCVHMFS